MAKGQLRSNKEAKKPKKDKVAKATVSPPGMGMGSTTPAKKK
jgi:hypothetical protein